MGIVWLALQISLNRKVALKILPPILAADPVRIVRFQSEAKVAAGLKHPNIVTVHEIGDLEGVVFFSMDYVQGQDLSRKAAERRMRPRQVMDLVKSVAEAIHYAHEKGVLHRDLKPSNILVDESGQPWVVDFGLARIIGQDSSITQTGEIVGSPAYIPPENIATTDVKPTVQADVYGLGGLLYYCLTQRAPYVADTVSATLQKVLTTDPLPIGYVRSDVPKDLEYIAKRCLAKDPADRYASAADVALDLEQVLLGRPLVIPKLVEPPPPRKQWMSRGMGIGLAAASIPLAVVLSGWTTFRGALLQESYFQKRAERLRQQSVDQYVSDVVLADRALGKGDTGAALALLDRIGDAPGMKDILGLEWFWLRSRLTESEGQRTWRVGEPVLSFTPMTGEECFAVATPTGISIVSAKAPSPELHCPLPGSVGVRTIERDSTAQSVWVGDDRGVHRMNLRSGDRSTLVSDSALHVRRSPTGNRLAAVLGETGPEGPAASVIVLEASVARPLARFPCEPNTLLGFLTDETLEGIGPTGRRWRWQLGQGERPEVRLEGEPGVVGFAVGPNLERFAHVDECHVLRVHRHQGSVLELEEAVVDDPASRLSFSERGDVLVHASPSAGTAWIRTAPDWGVRAVVNQVPSDLAEVHVSANPPTIYFATRDGTFQRRTWNALESRDLIAANLSPSGPTEVITSANGRWVAVGDARSNEAATTWVQDLSGVDRSLIRIPGLPVSLSPSDDLIVQSHGDGRIAVWDLEDRRQLAEFHSGIASSGLTERISGDGSILVILDAERRVRVLHLMTGLEIGGPKGKVLDLRISPDSRRLAFMTAGGAGIYDFGSGDQWHYAEGRFTVMEFSPDGRYVGLGDEGGGVSLYDVVARSFVVEGVAQASPIHALAFLADGRTMATGGGTNSIRLWSVPGLRELTRIPVSSSVRWLGARSGHTALLVGSEEGVRIIGAANPQAPLPPSLRKEGGFWEDPVTASARLSRNPFRDPGPNMSGGGP